MTSLTISALDSCGDLQIHLRIPAIFVAPGSQLSRRLFMVKSSGGRPLAGLDRTSARSLCVLKISVSLIVTYSSGS